jgi:hypothetical protein
MSENVLLITSIIGLDSVLLRHADQELESKEDEAAESEEEKQHSDDESVIVAQNTEEDIRMALSS